MAPSRPDIESTFEVGGRRLAYSVFGEGPKVTVLLHGLLFNQRMHGPLARTLAKRGHRVVTLDLLGHGRSERPEDMGEYSMGFFAQNVVALLDHLEVDEAVIGGTSLGANVTLEVCSAAPERVRGMIVEMPVLDNALLGCALAFTPLMCALTFGEPLMKVVQAGARLIPNEKLPFLLDLGVEWVQQDPRPSAAVLQGLFFGRIAPHRTERATFEAPTLVLGHHRDPVHPFSDADALLRELPNARLVEAGHFFELRLDPETMTREIGTFVDECWKPRTAPARPAKPRTARKKAS
jgi:pimeloyl-ACP methyl ester carboxylesterase